MPARDEAIGVSAHAGLAPLARLLASRRIAATVIVGSLTHLVLVGLGLPGWFCPLRATCGLPCPGCGLGRAGVLLLRGEWSSAVATHPFAPLLVLAILLMCGALVLPARAHHRLVQSVAILEQTTYVSLGILSYLVLFWLWRIAVG